jgi:hypothetical protein
MITVDNIYGLNYLYPKILVLQLIESTKKQAVVWDIISPTTCYTNFTAASRYYDVYLVNLGTSYKIDFVVNARRSLTVDSSDVPELVDLFQIIRLLTSNNDDLIQSVQNQLNASFFINEKASGGMKSAGVGVVGFTDARTIPPIRGGVIAGVAGRDGYVVSYKPWIGGVKAGGVASVQAYTSRQYQFIMQHNVHDNLNNSTDRSIEVFSVLTSQATGIGYFDAFDSTSQTSLFGIYNSPKYTYLNNIIPDLSDTDGILVRDSVIGDVGLFNNPNSLSPYQLNGYIGRVSGDFPYDAVGISKATVKFQLSNDVTPSISWNLQSGVGLVESYSGASEEDLKYYQDVGGGMRVYTSEVIPPNGIINTNKWWQLDSDNYQPVFFAEFEENVGRDVINGSNLYDSSSKFNPTSSSYNLQSRNWFLQFLPIGNVATYQKVGNTPQSLTAQSASPPYDLVGGMGSNTRQHVILSCSTIDQHGNPITSINGKRFFLSFQLESAISYAYNTGIWIQAVKHPATDWYSNFPTDTSFAAYPVTSEIGFVDILAATPVGTTCVVEVTTLLNDLFASVGWIAGNGVLFDISADQNSTNPNASTTTFGLANQNNTNPPRMIVMDDTLADAWVSYHKVYAINIDVQFRFDLSHTYGRGGSKAGGSSAVYIHTP